jgi:hypothetical protein
MNGQPENDIPRFFPACTAKIRPFDEVNIIEKIG